MTTSELADRVERAEGPSRELDAEIMFDLYAKPVGQHAGDGGPTGYLWPEDNASWAFGIRFPGKDRAWCNDARKRSETLVIERDGAVVLMNSLRIPKLTASLDAALTLVPEGWAWMVGADMGEGFFASLMVTEESGLPRGEVDLHGVATPALALTSAALRARARAAAGPSGAPDARDGCVMTSRPNTLNMAARYLSDAQITAEEAWLGAEWDRLRDALEESGGHGGSPGEWIWERMGELETEHKRRQTPTPGAA